MRRCLRYTVGNWEVLLQRRSCARYEAPSESEDCEARATLRPTSLVFSATHGAYSQGESSSTMAAPKSSFDTFFIDTVFPLIPSAFSLPLNILGKHLTSISDGDERTYRQRFGKLKPFVECYPADVEVVEMDVKPPKRTFGRPVTQFAVHRRREEGDFPSISFNPQVMDLLRARFPMAIASTQPWEYFETVLKQDPALVDGLQDLFPYLPESAPKHWAVLVALLKHPESTTPRVTGASELHLGPLGARYTAGNEALPTGASDKTVASRFEVRRPPPSSDATKEENAALRERVASLELDIRRLYTKLLRQSGPVRRNRRMMRK